MAVNKYGHLQHQYIMNSTSKYILSIYSNEPITVKNTYEAGESTTLNMSGFGSIMEYYKAISNQNVSIEDSDFSMDDTRNIIPGDIIAIALSIVAICANMLSLLAIYHVKGGLSTNLRLIRSLTLSDILVSISILLKVVNETVNPWFLASENLFSMSICMHTILHGLVMTSHIISLLNLIGLAVDHYFAIVRPLEYPILMSHKRVNIMITVFWILAFLFGFSDFLIPTQYYYTCEKYPSLYNYCEVVYCTTFEPEHVMFCVVLISFISMTFMYLRVFLCIRSYQNTAGRHKRYIRRNTRGLVTTLFILGTFIFLWLPYCIFEVTITLNMLVKPLEAINYLVLHSRASSYLYDLILINSLCDPVIYAIRMKEVRLGIRKLLMRCSKQGRHRLMRQTTFERKTSIVSAATMMNPNAYMGIPQSPHALVPCCRVMDRESAL